MEATPLKRLLALDPSFGSVCLCPQCDQLHLRLGDMHVRMNLQGFQALVILINRAAANYELWAEAPGGAA